MLTLSFLSDRLMRIAPRRSHERWARRLALGAFLLSSACSADAPGFSEGAGDPTLDEQKIVGGTVVKDPGKFPFFVRGGGCGGVLINEDIVVSAADCAGAFPRLYIGSGSSTEGGYVEYRHSVVSKEHIHPKYNAKNGGYNVMVFKIDPVTTSKLKQALANKPVTLNFDVGVPVDNQVLTTMGFGAINEDRTTVNEFRKVDVEYVSDEECSQIYPNLQRSAHLCAGVDEGGKDACYGDAGGPLLTKRNVLVGLVSRGVGCARKGFPGTYTRISQVSGWIKRKVCSLSDYPPEFCNK